MMSYLSELRLSEYFSICAVLGEHLKDRKKLFCLLGEIFLQPQAETEELFKEAESEALLEIDSEGAYFRHCRIRQYCTLAQFG